jgi:hypothetical protein
VTEPTYALTSQAPVEFWPPRVEPSPHGLCAVVDWIGEDDAHPDRFLIAGVRFRNYNFGSEISSGVWGQSWCLAADGVVPTPGGAKVGTRPAFPATYEPVVAWAYDSCDLTPGSQDEVLMHAEQWLQLNAPLDVERSVATRMLTDAGSLPSTLDFVTALGNIEAAIALTGTRGFVHAPANVAALASLNECLKEPKADSDWQWETPLGNVWVFGGGYCNILVSGSDFVMTATSQPYGWRNNQEIRTVVDHHFNQFVAVAERSFLVGYENFIGAAVVTPG